jgi:hypothetical protein
MSTASTLSALVAARALDVGVWPVALIALCGAVSAGAFAASVLLLG